jgi:hypothetical protein
MLYKEHLNKNKENRGTAENVKGKMLNEQSR